MTTRPHDALFKLAFEQPDQLAALCREQLAPELAQAIAWDTVKPAPGSLVDPKLADFHTDALFSVELAGHPAYLYVVVEHQSTVDELMPLRMLHYMVRVWMRQAREQGAPLSPVVSVLLSHTPGGWRGGQTVHDIVEPSPELIPGLADFVPNVSFVLDDLMSQSDEQLRARGLEKGREEGRKEGREEGRAATLRSTLTKLLTLKFGEAADARDPQIEAATPEQLELYIERILAVDSLDQLFR